MSTKEIKKKKKTITSDQFGKQNRSFILKIEHTVLQEEKLKSNMLELAKNILMNSPREVNMNLFFKIRFRLQVWNLNMFSCHFEFVFLVLLLRGNMFPFNHLFFVLDVVDYQLNQKCSLT